MSLVNAIIFGNIIAACFNVLMIGVRVPEWVIWTFWPAAIVGIYIIGNLYGLG